jgi:bacillithiol system protein YtxJ
MSDLVRDSEKAPNNTRVYFLDLLQYRSLSQKIAEDLNVAHQSPQLIIISKGKVVQHASHHAIRWSNMTADISSGKQV